MTDTIVLVLIILALWVLVRQVRSNKRQSPIMSAQWKRRMLKEAHRQRGKGNTLR